MERDLLAPRFKVIAPFPNMFFVGESGFTMNWIIEPVVKSDKHFYNGVCLDTYPHLFRKLSWWEMRQESEMPEYVKCDSTDFIKFKKEQVIRVEKHQSNTYNQFVAWLFISKDKQGDDPMMNCVPYKNFLPATLTEYESFKSKNSK